jgi:hypothetical protein
MTEQDFSDQILPAIHALWPRVVKLNVKPVREHGSQADLYADQKRYERDLAAAKEKNNQAWRIVRNYQAEDALDAIRRVGETHIDFPEHRGRGWVLNAIRQELRQRYGVPAGQDDDGGRPRFDPAAWTWQDEANLWFVLADLARSGKEMDELEVARKRLGKNPSIDERDRAYQILCNHVSEARKRATSRDGITPADAERRYPFPRDVVEEIRQGRADWLAARAEQAVCANMAAEMAEMFGGME